MEKNTIKKFTNKTNMKTKEEIDELYYKYWEDFNDKYDDNLHYYSFVEGYLQCQEDMADKKYTEADIRKAFNAGVAWGRADYIGINQPFAVEDEFINSLNKQD